jgi:hypothetical protein
MTRSGLAEGMVWNGSVRFIVSSGQPNSGPGELTMGRTVRISFSRVCRGVSRANTGQMPRYGRRFVVLLSGISLRDRSFRQHRSTAVLVGLTFGWVDPYR